MAKKTSSSRDSTTSAIPPHRAILWTLAAGAWALLAAALASYSPADWPNAEVALHHEAYQNWVGKVGALTSYRLYATLGPGVWIAMIGGATYLTLRAAGRKVDQLPLRTAGVGLMTVASSGLIAVGALALLDGYRGGPYGGLWGLPGGPGGMLSVFVSDQLVPRFAVAGSLVLLGVAFWIGAVLTADRLVLMVPRMLGESLLRLFNFNVRVGRKLAVGGASVGGAARHLGEAWSRREPLATAATTRTPKKRKGRRDEIDPDDAEDHDDDVIPEDAGGLGATESFGTDRPDRRPGLRVVDEDADEDDDDEDELVLEAADASEEEDASDESRRRCSGGVYFVEEEVRSG